MNYPTELEQSKVESRLRRLKEYYSIHGDGVARVRLDKITKDEEFREAIKKISKIETGN